VIVVNIKQNYKKIIGASLVINLIVIALCMTFVLSAPNSSIFTITSGIYPSAPTYTIWEEDSVYYAKSAYGKIDFSGDDPAQIAQDCIDTIGVAIKGDIDFTSGIFNFKKTVTVTKYKTISGSGISTLIATHSNIGAFNITGDEVTIRDMKIANYYENNTKSGIHIHKVPNVWLTNLFISDFYIGIKGVGAITGTWGLFVRDSIIHLNEEYGIYFEGYSGSKIKGNHFSGGVGVETVSGIKMTGDANYNEIIGNHFDDMNQGVDLDGAYSITIVGNDFENIRFEDIKINNAVDVTISGNALNGAGWGTYGILIDTNASYISVTGNVVREKGRHGIFVDKTGNRHISIVSNIVRDNSRETNNTWSGIATYDVNDVVITGNNCFDNQTSEWNRQKYGIETGGASDYIIIIGNDCRSNVDATEDISYVGSNNKVAYNLGRYTPQGSA